MSSVLEALGSPTAVIGLGATTVVLLGTTWYYLVILSGGSGGDNGSSGDNGRGRRTSNGIANGHRASFKELDRSKYPGGHLAIYYGSQTGTAQMFARQIASESESRGFRARVVDLQDVVDNDDAVAISDAAEEEGFSDDIDDDAAVIRATVADPRYRDVDEGDGVGKGGGRSRAVLLVATYGEGEPTDNAQQFVEMMKGKSGISNIYKLATAEAASSSTGGGGGYDGAPERTISEASSISLEEEPADANATTAALPAATDAAQSSSSARHASFLRDVDYAVFGLGNKQYEHYNNMGRFADAALKECGASRISPIGLGDDDDDLEGDFETWKDNVFWPAMTERYVSRGAQLDASQAAAKEEGGEGTGTTKCALPLCPYRAEYLKSDERLPPSDPTLVQTSSKHYSQSWDCPVVAKRELRDPSDPGSTIHMEIDISKHAELGYVTADNLGILPKNDAATVEAVAEALGFDLDRRFHLLPNPEKNEDDPSSAPDSDPTSSSKHTLPFPTPCTVRDALERYCDLSGPPRRSDLKRLAPYARDDIDRKALLRMSSKEGKAEYREKIVDAHVGIADIVATLCKSIQCPLEHFVMVCPRLQPRYYTISSSSTVHPTTIHITLAVLEAPKKKDDGNGGGVFTGVCSGYLSRLKHGEVVRAFVRESAFRLPKQIERPVIMFGPGTGIAPMRALLQEMSASRKEKTQHGTGILYFGCKSRSMDYIYRDELEAFKEEGTLSQLHLAFSREQKEKVYVQHLLSKRGEETWRLIHDERASIFVCGAVKMGADVDHALRDIISREGGMSQEGGKAYLDKMAVAGRFVQELWS